MKSFAKPILVSSVSLALGLGVAGNAHANAYSLAYDNVTNLFINALNTTFSLPSSVNSRASACQNNPTCQNQGGAGVTNSAFAAAAGDVVGANPTGYTEDFYISGAAGKLAANDNLPSPREGTGGSWSLADAQIVSQQTLGNPFTQAVNMAEGQLVGDGTANANAGNSSATTFNVGFTAGPNAVLNFAFDANALLKAVLTTPPDYIFPSQADASISVSFAIRDNVTGQNVFQWAPDGTAGGITGGTELRDSFSLNTNVAALPGSPGPFTYVKGLSNVAGDCQVGTFATGIGLLAGGCFNATTTLQFVDGRAYNLSISMTEVTNQQLTTTIPEIDSVAGTGALTLLAGAMALVGDRRRRHPSA